MDQGRVTCAFNGCPHNPQPLLLLLLISSREVLQKQNSVDNSRGSVPNPEVTGRARTLYRGAPPSAIEETQAGTRLPDPHWHVVVVGLVDCRGKDAS
jgi:hypothetical protein